jgi:hypothetical protein
VNCLKLAIPPPSCVTRAVIRVVPERRQGGANGVGGSHSAGDAPARRAIFRPSRITSRKIRRRYPRRPCPCASQAHPRIGAPAAHGLEAAHWSVTTTCLPNGTTTPTRTSNRRDESMLWSANQPPVERRHLYAVDSGRCHFLLGGSSTNGGDMESRRRRVRRLAKPT